MSETKLRPIFQLATQAVLNDKAESVIVSKVLCPLVDEETGNTKLQHVSDCMECEHYLGIPNQYVVSCKHKGDAPEEPPVPGEPEGSADEYTNGTPEPTPSDEE